MSLALMAARGTHDRPGGWTPKNLGTLDLWLDADDATTITIATGVSQWNDKSGNGRNVTQPTGANQPLWVTGVQNGRAVVRCNGAGRYLNGGDVLDINAGGISIVYVNYTPNSNQTPFIAKSSGSANENGEWIVFAGTQVRIGGTLVTSGVNSTRSVTKMASWVMDRSTGTKYWMYGELDDTDSAAPFPNTTSYNTVHDFRVGGRVTAETAGFNGDIHEIIVSMTALSDADRQKCEGYLAHKWGLTENMPSDHPYKSVAP